MDGIGPQEIIKKTCKGCPALETKWWKDYLENDETDSGTSAKCKAIEGERNIASYWSEGYPVPSWCPGKTPKDQPLTIEVKDSRLVISIGVDTLAFADKERTGIKVTDPTGFAHDVELELCREEEDGSTILTDLLDKAMDAAVDQGSLHIEV